MAFVLGAPASEIETAPDHHTSGAANSNKGFYFAAEGAAKPEAKERLFAPVSVPGVAVHAGGPLSVARLAHFTENHPARDNV